MVKQTINFLFQKKIIIILQFNANYIESFSEPPSKERYEKKMILSTIKKI